MARYEKTALQVFVSGGKGQGKTTLTDAIAKTYGRIFVFDPNGEYRAKGYTQCASMAEVLQHVRKNWRKGWRVSFVPVRPRSMFSGDSVVDAKRERGAMTQQLNEFCALICEIQKPYFDTPDGKQPPQPKVCLIVDEMRWSYPQHASCEWLEVISTLGRHYGVDVIGTTVRFAEVSTMFRGNCDLQFFFAQHDATDLQTVSRMIGRENVPALRSLRPHEFLRVYHGKVERGKNPLKR